MERRYSEYMPLMSGKPRRRRRVLRTAKLNIVGRAAVVGSCLIAAGLGFAAGRFLGWPAAVTTSAGGLLPLALLAAVDRRRWRAMLAAHGWGGTADEVSAVASDLLRRGVVTNVEIHLEDDVETASLWYRNADADVVSTVLAEHGLPAIDPWF
jgi:hypothetical protein